jgi:hypothetical protein
LTPLIVLPDDEASRRLMRETDAIYDQRHREHSRNGCVSMAREYLCKICRSYEAGRNVALEKVRALVEVDPAVRDDAGQNRCLYCKAELNGEGPGPTKGHEATCAWQSVRQLLDRPGGPGAPRAV